MLGLRVLDTRLNRGLRWARSSWIDIAWALFVALNLAAMRLLPAWETVPFLIIWVSLTIVYGFRLWPLQPAILTLSVVTLATGGIIGIQVLHGQQDADYLAEVPLIALMFLVMVWHGRRRQTALEARLAAMEEVQRISGEPAPARKAAALPARCLARAWHADHGGARPRGARRAGGHRQAGRG